jgi:tetratricopeptide (TPR) repeat protein
MTFWRKEAKSRVFWSCLILAVLCGCKKSAPTEEKTLRTKLAYELRHHSYEQALPVARRLLEIAPQDNGVWKRLVQAQIALHDLDGAADTLGQWHKIVRSPTTRLEEYEGDLAREKQDPQRSLQAWLKVLASQPKNRRVLQKIALLKQSQGRWAEAITAWSRALQVRDDAFGWINLAVCQRRLRDWDHAFEDFHRAQQLAPEDPEVLHWSKLFERLSKFLEQIRELDAKIAAAPDDAGLLADRALTLLRTGDPELALDDCVNAGRLAPWAARPKLFQAIALIALNRANECEQLLISQHLRLEALTPEFLETVSRLDSAISVEPANSEHFAKRSWQLNEIGQPLLALKDAEKASLLDPKSASAAAEVAYALMKLGRSREAFEKIKQATELDADLASAWQYRGELEMAAGDHLAAIESLSKALAIQQTAAALQKREECYRRVGLQARADEDHRALQQLSARSFK